jgi:hypothetical protein
MRRPGSYPLTSIVARQWQLPGGYRDSDDGSANFIQQC